MNLRLKLILLFICGIVISCIQDTKINLLILSGSNNHEWENTTPFLEKMYSQSGLFEIKVIDNPSALNPDELAYYDVIVSNWNSWPENDLRWSADLEKALLAFVENGGGFVTFHASSSAFYKWPEFKSISTAAWIDSTWHGEKSATQVLIQDIKHPVTKGLEGFYIEDELWINAEKNGSFKVIGSAANKDILQKGLENQPAIFVKESGKGRIFHTILGHDVRTMRNIGFQTLMLRGTEWAASGNVTQDLPAELRVERILDDDFHWIKTDSSFQLNNNQNVVWKYNFKEMHGKPFFHPINLGRNNLTCLSPDDHIWHVGLWFSWKFINGVNYWEYQDGTYQSEGVTEITGVKTTGKSDYSAEIELDIVYHPLNEENVLAEKRIINVSPPNKKGHITMDYQFEFKALADSVDINRTPILGEPNGKSWGGYSGISIRFNQDFMDSGFISSWGERDSVNGKRGDWLYMGFTGLDGEKVGSQIIIAPDSHTEGEAWYSVNTNDLPFYYFSPAILYSKSKLLLKNDKLVLKYRINHFGGKINKAELEQEFQKYKKELNQ
jgi:type 1 glutamine amidotransferase